MTGFLHNIAFKTPGTFFTLVYVCLILLQPNRCLTRNGKQTEFVKKRGATQSYDENVKSKFEVNTNTIILTAESRSMGAKYINESELNSNQECLIWCSEIANCNVAVFEEMRKNWCFLFDCGSPSDFRCSFTGHNFYTSSIKNTRHSFDLKQWGKDVKSKNEVLEPLEVPDPVTGPLSTLASVVTTTVTSATTVAVPSQAIDSAKTQRLCSHYQFQCVNSTECIAIYNVCDGIPQCPNGSDEGTELDCPNKGSAVKPTSKLTSIEAPPVQNNRNQLVYASLAPPVPPKEPQKIPQEQHILVKPIVPHKAPPGGGEGRAKQPQQRPQSNVNKLQPPPPSVYKEDSDKTAWQDSYGRGNQQSSDYDHAVDGSGSRSPFAHKHSKFVAANDPRFQYPAKWTSEDYEHYPQQSSGLDQQYASAYENGYQRLNEGYPKNLYPDYDRTLYDNYHQDDSPYWSESDRLRSAAGANSYRNTEYLQPSVAVATNKQPSYAGREGLYLQRQRTKGSEDVVNPYVASADAVDVPNVVAHRMREPHRPAIEEGYQLPQQQLAKPQLQPHQYEDLGGRKQYRIYTDSRPLAYDGAPQSASGGGLYTSEDALRESLAHQDIPNKPIHIYEPVVEFPTTETMMAEHLPKLALTTAGARESEAGPTTRGYSDNNTKSPNSHQGAPAGNPPHPKVLMSRMTAAELYQSQAIHSRESNNAILALVLGLFITALLVVLVGCRLKTIKRRSGRRGRTLAHDADYLVNGLYL